MEGQISFADLDIWCGKMSPEPSRQTEEKISAPSLKKRQGSATRMPLFLDLRTDRNGQTPDASWDRTLASLGNFMTHSTGEFHNAEDGFVCYAISTDGRPPKSYLTLNIGEKPRVPRPTKLSQILEHSPDQKYNLSEKACQGILNRAAKRGKDLPKELKDALENQVTRSKLGGGVEVDSKGKRAGKGALVQEEMSGTLGVSQDQTLIQTHCIDQGAGKSSNQVLADMGPTLSTTHYGAPAVCYGISPYASNAMLSDNPNSGIYEADTSRTLDLNGGSPACNQGGVAVVQKALTVLGKQQSLNVQEEIAGTIGSNDYKEPQAVMTQKALNGWDVQSKHIQPQDGIAEALYSGECRYGGGESYVMAVDAWNGTEAEECNGNLQSSAAHNIHSNNVVRVSSS